MTMDTRALSGLKVVDLSRVLGGPYCAQTLADHGAHVIKVEPPQGDETRAWGPPFDDRGLAAYYLGVNRNKQGMVIDLSRAEGRAIVLRLLEDADVLIENFKIGTLERWDLGYEDCLRERFPRLIHCRVSGFGADGPLGGAPGYDAVAQAMGGLMSINGSPESGATRIGIPIVDLTTGLSATIGVLLALAERNRSGRGQFVDATLYDTAVSLLHPHASNWFISGKPPRRSGNAHPNIVPYDKYPTATCEVFLGIGNNGQFRKFCEYLGKPELTTDPRFADNQDRIAHRGELRELLERELHQVDGHALCTALTAAGVPAGPVQTVPEVLTHPHTLHRQMALRTADYTGTGIPLKLSRTPGEIKSSSPTFGRDTREVLRAHGYTTGEIQALLDAGVVIAESSAPETPREGPPV